MQDKEEKEQIIEQLDTVYNNVCSLLHKYPTTRESDKVLLILYWVTFDKVDFSKLSTMDEKEIERLTPYETISRCRRKIQNELKLLQPSEETKIKRRIKEHAFKEWSR